MLITWSYGYGAAAKLTIGRMLVATDLTCRVLADTSATAELA